MLRPSQRMEHVQTPVIPIIGEWIAAHPGTISLGQGVVHYAPPPQVTQAVCQALRQTDFSHRYGPVQGGDELLDKIRHKLQLENHLPVEQGRVICTAGSNMGFLNAILAIADVGDEIVLLSPYYFNHHMAIEMAGCRAVTVGLDDDYHIDVSAVAAAISPRTRAVVTISPNNPSGCVYSPRQLDAINQLCQQHACYHISDEAYEYFVYDAADHYSPGSRVGAAPHTISLFSLSKAYGMAGWRIGYMFVPPELEIPIKKIQDTNLICPPLVCQAAAAAALDAGRDWCRINIHTLQETRGQVFEQLDPLAARCRIAPSRGALYALLEIEHHRWSDLDLVQALIRDFGVAVLPGSTFGMTSHCGLRLSYGGLLPHTVHAGIGRLVHGLQSLL